MIAASSSTVPSWTLFVPVLAAVLAGLAGLLAQWHAQNRTDQRDAEGWRRGRLIDSYLEAVDAAKEAWSAGLKSRAEGWDLDQEAARTEHTDRFLRSTTALLLLAPKGSQLLAAIEDWKLVFMFELHQTFMSSNPYENEYIRRFHKGAGDDDMEVLPTADDACDAVELLVRQEIRTHDRTPMPGSSRKLPQPQ